MKSILLYLLFMLPYWNLGYCQFHEWSFDSLIINGYNKATNYGTAAVNIPGFKNAYSVTLDPLNRIWCGSYYSRRNEFNNQLMDVITVIKGTDTLEYEVKPIFVLDQNTGVIDTIRFLNLPDGTIDTLVNGHRGMKTDYQGNIIASFADGSVYKINFQNYNVIAKYQTDGNNGRPGVDAQGFVYQMDGVFAGKVDILHPFDWSRPYNTIDNISAGVTRCLEVSPDGRNVYICSQMGGIYHYFSPDGVYGSYALKDTILRIVFPDSNSYIFEANLAQWDPNGLLWVASYDDADFRAIYKLDPDQNYLVVDSLTDFEFWGNTDKSDTTSGGYPQPQYLRCIRDACFDPCGFTFYAAEFYGYGIKKYSMGICGLDEKRNNELKVETCVIHPVYPNPFNPTTTIPFELQKSAHVVLRIYDMRGSLIGKYIDRQMKTGLHEFTFNGDNLASGYYYFKLTVDHSVFSGKMLLLK